MPIVSAKCTNCGSNLNVDNTKDAMVCPYCGSAFIVEKAINNYYTTNNIQAGVVNIYGGNESEFVIHGGVLEKYNGNDENIIIPSTVKAVVSKAFEGCLTAKRITASEGVTSFAIYNCPTLTELNLPNSLNSLNIVDAPALKNVDLPPNLEKLYIASCAIVNIDFPNSIKELVCKNCNSIKNVRIPNGITSIQDDAFTECEIS